ncbi:MAG: FkbM family methyltransferase [Magnetococcales bacterium]|nr:FkbM family methyltransferase [Magnetococcales bacterium]MBF0321336.1 FkbM family methyltransferase [Magnetococcales bacterium]
MLLKVVRRFEFPRKYGLYDRLFGESLARLGIVDIETGAHLTWKLDLRNSPSRWIVYGLYDANFLMWAKRFVPKDGIIVDSGANIGQMAMYLGQMNPVGRLFAFEPGSHQADWLAGQLEKNRRHLPSVELHRLGLGNKEEQLFLQNHGSEDTHGGQSQIRPLRGEPVQMVRLDRFLNERGIRHVDLWKLDVEDHEIPAMEGAMEFLESHRIRAIYAELHGDNGLAIREFLQRLGYRILTFSSWGRDPGPENIVGFHDNGLFVPSDS